MTTITPSRPAFGFADFVERVTGRRPAAYEQALVELMETRGTAGAGHGAEACSCPWWYFPEPDGQGGWYVSRLCGAFHVRVTAPLKLSRKSWEHMAADKARRLNRLYGLPDPRDPQPPAQPPA